MLIEFKFCNYRSFRDDAVLSMEATGLGTMKECLIDYGNMRLLPGVAIYGKKRRRQKQCDKSLLAGGAVYPERTENTA